MWYHITIEDMENPNDKLDILLDRLSSIIKRQESFSAEIDAIRKEIIHIKMSTPETNQEFDEELVPEISHALQPDTTLQESNPTYGKSSDHQKLLITFESNL